MAKKLKTRKYQVTCTYVIEVEAADKDDAENQADQKLTTTVEGEFETENLTCCSDCGDEDSDLYGDLEEPLCEECIEERNRDEFGHNQP